MQVLHEVHIADPFGVPLKTLTNFTDSPDGAGLEYVLSAGKIGALRLTVPASYGIDDLFRLDGRIGVWRSINGRPLYLDGDAIYLIRQWEYTDDMTIITAVHANDLLRRRVIAYDSGTTYTDKAATYADDLVKTFVAENLGSSISAANRDGSETQADISTYVSIQPDLSFGASIAKAAARRNLFDVITGIGAASMNAGTYLTTDIVASTTSTLEVRTYATCRGIDHRASSSQPVILSRETGTLANARLTIDRTSEVTYVIAAGAGQGAIRLICTAVDTARMGESPFNRCEKLADHSNITDSTSLQNEADAALRDGKPVKTFTADLNETDGMTRGIHYDLGDLVTASLRGQQYDVRLDVIGVSVRQGEYKSQVQLRVDI